MELHFEYSGFFTIGKDYILKIHVVGKIKFEEFSA